MIFNSTSLLFYSLFVAAVWVAGPAAAAIGSLRSRRLAPTAECTLMVSQALHTNPTGSDEEEESFDCLLDPSETGGIANMVYPLGISMQQKKELKQMLRDREFTPSDASLQVAGAVWDGLQVKLPPGKLKNKVKKGKKFAQGRRNLAVVEGIKPSKSLFW
jgi:hypothetical protein